MITGLDLSYAQGHTTDFRKVKAAGHSFVFVREADGVTSLDMTVGGNIQRAQEAGLYVGCYHFFRPKRDVSEQAALLFSQHRNIDPAWRLPPVLDVEVGDGVDPPVVANKINSWVLQATMEIGRLPIIYAGTGPWAQHVKSGAFGFCPLWVAAYGFKEPPLPKGWTRWDFWQVSGTGRVDGVRGDVDLNVWRGTLEELRDFAEGVCR